jgi:hypothetical protein
MGNKFVIFSTELGASVHPYDEYDNYASIVKLDRDPMVTGKYDPHAGTTFRGSVIPTLGGVVVQDFGVQIQDQRIQISDEGALSLATVTAINVMYIVSDAQYYFTDGYDCYKVRFSRPNGFVYRRNLVPAFYGIGRFDYEINFVVLEKAI